MSATIKAAITALKGRIAAAYSAISAKGGTLPATQDSDNLASAIATIPSGGGEITTMTASTSGSITNRFSLIDGSKWDVSTPTALNHLFNGCGNLVSLVDISAWDMSNKTTVASLFNNCSNLETIGDVSNWDFGVCTNLSNIFSGNYKIRLPKKLNWNITNVLTNLQSSFSNCRVITELDLSSWNVSGVTNMSTTFNACYVIEKIDLSNWVMNAGVNMTSAFDNCKKLSNLILTNASFVVTSLNATFRTCSVLTSLDLRGFDTTNCTSMSQTFGNDSSLTSIRVGSGWVKGCDLSPTGLQHDGLVQFFNDLPTISDSQTITLGSTKLGYLSAAEKAIATDKGWTLA